MVSTFAERMYELRTEKGISQKEAAEGLGVSQALLSHYEKGIRECGLSFLCRAADFYEVTADYVLGRTQTRTSLGTADLEDREEDKSFSTATVYRAAIMTHERMNAGSALAGEKADYLYAIAVYRTLFSAAAKGYIPKRWFTLPPRYSHGLSIAMTETIIDDFPEKTTTAKRYGGPEPFCIETVIRSVEGLVRKAALTVKPAENKQAE